MSKYHWVRGSDYTLKLEAIDGDADQVDSIRCVLKAALKNFTSPGDAAAEKLVFSSEYTPATADDYAYWLLTGSAADSEDLTPGDYVMDARLVMGSGVIVTSALGIVIVERVTEAS